MNDHQKYLLMWDAFQKGLITQQEWKSFCMDFLNGVILTNPEIVAVMKRLKDR